MSRDADGQPQWIDGLVWDITERKREEARLRRFYETDLFAILYWKIDGGVIDVNDKFLEMTGYSPEDVLRRACELGKNYTAGISGS